MKRAASTGRLRFVRPAAQNPRLRLAGIRISPDAPSLAVRVVGALALVLVVSVGPGAASTREAVSTHATPPKVIRLVSANLTFRLLVDKPPQGSSKGDTISTTNVLANAVAQFGLAKGAVVGSDAGRTTNVDAVPMTADVLVRLPGGTLRVRGRSRRVGQTRVVPVVGGTGQFKGAIGTLTVQAIPHSPDLSNVYRLSYSSARRAVASRG
jgi:hypothetical protein